MATDPKSSVSPVNEIVEKEVAEALAGLTPFSVRALLGTMLTELGQTERRAYLDRVKEDKGNGSYARSLMVGSLPVEIQVPRTRSGAFRPHHLPAPHERGYPEETQSLLLGLLSSSRSLNAAKATLHRLGLSGSERDIETVAANFWRSSV
jgi:transposase-like protein